MQQEDREQINLLVDLTTNKINEQLRAHDKFSEAIYRILVTLDQVKDSVKKGEGWFFQNLNNQILRIENECKQLNKSAEKFETLNNKANIFFDTNNLSLQQIKDEFDVFSSFVHSINEHIEDLNKKIEDLDKHVGKHAEESKEKLNKIENSIGDLQKQNLKLDEVHEIINEFKTDKNNFVTWKGKLLFSFFILGPLLSFVLILQQIGLINIKVTLGQ